MASPIGGHRDMTKMFAASAAKRGKAIVDFTTHLHGTPSLVEQGLKQWYRYCSDLWYVRLLTNPRIAADHDLGQAFRESEMLAKR
jgi:hypothetical protein